MLGRNFQKLDQTKMSGVDNMNDNRTNLNSIIQNSDLDYYQESNRKGFRKRTAQIEYDAFTFTDSITKKRILLKDARCSYDKENCG